MYSKNWLTLLMVVAFYNLTLGQSDLFKVSLNQQINASSQIVEGKVVAKKSMWDKNHHNIYTINTVEVYKIFKGQTQTTVDIITEGGVVDMEAQHTSASLNLSIGDIGTFMLHSNEVLFPSENASSFQKYSAYSAAQGFYKYDLLENRVSNPFTVVEGISDQFYEDITSRSHANFIKVSSFDINAQVNSVFANRASDGMAITSFSPQTLSAGTRSVLTINGTGFGTAIGSVAFRDADIGGESFDSALTSQVVSWTDTQIKVEVPSNAGTGNFRVISPIGTIVSSANDITISYAELNVTSANIAYPTQHVDDNNNGGYTWSMYTSFFLNAQANLSFTRAFDSWRCETGINWDISPAFSTVNTASADGTNVIRFDIGNELPAGVLGRNTSYFNGCSVGGVVKWYVMELDIVFDSAANWQFGPGAPNNSQIDFETVAVHELGHGHQLGHVINPGAIMHYAINNGTFNRFLSPSDIAGGNDVQSRSTTIAICGFGLMTNHACSLGVDENELDSLIAIYPNPAKGQIFIKNNNQLSIQTIELFDVTGRSVKKLNYLNPLNLYTIDSNNLSTGVYVINITTEGSTLTKKIVIQ